MVERAPEQVEVGVSFADCTPYRTNRVEFGERNSRFMLYLELYANKCWAGQRARPNAAIKLPFLRIGSVLHALETPPVHWFRNATTLFLMWLSTVFKRSKGMWLFSKMLFFRASRSA